MHPSKKREKDKEECEKENGTMDVKTKKINVIMFEVVPNPQLVFSIRFQEEGQQ